MKDNPYLLKLPGEKADLYKSVISTIDIELTERCNNACIHCLINQPENDHNVQSMELSTGEILDILKQAADLGVINVRFTGGEPLLRRDFKEIYLAARRLGMIVTISTNARLITPEFVELLKKYPTGKPMMVSVYGLTAKTYDKVTANRGAFDEFTNGLHLLRESNIPFKIKQSLLPPNASEVKDFEALSREINPGESKPEFTTEFYFRTRRDSDKKNAAIRKLRCVPEKVVEIMGGAGDFKSELISYLEKNNKLAGSALFQCGAGLKPAVDAYGNIQMCLLLRHPDTVYKHTHVTTGNSSALKHNDLKDAVTGFFPLVRETKASNTDYLNKCAACRIKPLCKQCPAISWMEHGTLDTPVEYFCEITHAIARHIGVLREGEKGWLIDTEEWDKRLSETT